MTKPTLPQRLYILHKLPTPYMDDLFRAIHASEDIDVQVYHLWKGSGRRPWKSELGTGYPNRYMTPRFGLDWTSVRAALTDRHSLFLVADWAHAPTIAPLVCRLLVRAPVGLWVDTPQEQLHRPFLKRTLRAVFLRLLLRNVRVILGSGKPAARALTGMGAPREKIVNYQIVVDTDRPGKMAKDPGVAERARALREQVGCGHDGVVFAMCGTIDLAKKAQDLGVRAFAKCAERMSRPAGLLIAGSGKGEQELKRLADELGVTDRVGFLGWQEPGQMDSVYLAADVVFHPAHYDPFPLVVIEAMSWGNPVIGSDACGSVEEKVRDGVNGYAFRAGDEAGAVEAMVKLCADPETLRRASLAARETAEVWPISRAVDVIRQQVRRYVR